MPRGKKKRQARSARAAKPARRSARRNKDLPTGVTYETERDGLIDAIRAGQSAAWKMGRHWFFLKKFRLWWPTYRNAAEFLKEELVDRGLKPPHASTLSHYSLVALTFSELVAMDISVGALYAALTWWAHKGITDFSRDDPGGELIEIPTEIHGSFIKKPLSACTEEDLKAANAYFKTAGNSGLTVPEAATEKLLQVGLSKVVGDDGRGKIHLSHAHGKLYVSLSIRTSVDRIAPIVKVLERLK
jgi:hypothetical protein